MRHHKIGAFDIDGVFRGKYVERKKLESVLETGFGFCDVVMGWECLAYSTTTPLQQVAVILR